MTTQSLPYTPLTTICLPPPGLPSAGEVMARAATENFRVASRLLPARTRQHLLAFYGFARLVDQIGDAYPGDRMAALDWVASEVRAGPGGAHELIAAAVRSAAALGCDPQPLLDLVEANRLDQRATSYATFDDLLAYCRLSANPVGRLVLAAFGADTPARREWSDAVCTGLQLAEHWQDVAEDARAGRVYVPAEDLRRFGIDPAALTAAPPAGTELRALLAFEVARARPYFDAGAPLVASLRGRARWAVAGFVAGGKAALDAIAAQGFDPLAGAPRPAPTRVARHLVAALRQPASGPEGAA